MIKEEIDYLVDKRVIISLYDGAILQGFIKTKTTEEKQRSAGNIKVALELLIQDSQKYLFGKTSDGLSGVFGIDISDVDSIHLHNEY